jgi:hypothetical protein
MPDKEPIYLEFTTDGHVVCPWWTKEAEKILDGVGPSAPGYEEVNKNPYCG